MKSHYGLALMLLTGTLAFGQQPIHGGASGSSGTVAAPANKPDSGGGNAFQVKSIHQVLHDNPQLVERMKVLLPSDIKPDQACSEYKALDLCLSAIHVSSDLKIPFNDLKSATTGKHPIGLEKAIAQLVPAANAHDAAKKAKAEASQDLKGISLFGD